MRSTNPAILSVSGGDFRDEIRGADQGRRSGDQGRRGKGVGVARGEGLHLVGAVIRWRVRDYIRRGGRE